MKLMAPGHRELFRACASVLVAAVRLAPAGYGAGTISGNLVERLTRAKTKAERERLTRKLFAVYWRIDPDLRTKTAQADPRILREFEERETHLLSLIAKKKGKAATVARSGRLTAEALRRDYPLAYLMLTNWLRCGHLSDPGFFFYSDSALAELFSILNWKLGSEQIEQMRGRLGLRKANAKRPLVTAARLNPDTNLIELNTFDAKAAKFEWPKPPWTLRCRLELSGRVLYAGAPS